MQLYNGDAAAIENIYLLLKIMGMCNRHLVCASQTYIIKFVRLLMRNCLMYRNFVNHVNQWFWMVHVVGSSHIHVMINDSMVA